jgi:gluconolactonase
VDDKLSDLIEEGEPQQLATGFQFTEGPLWHPDGFFYFVDIRANRIYQITPGQEPVVFRENSGGGNGTTFDLSGNLIVCEGGNRRVTRTDASGSISVLADNYQGKRLNAPNDVVCRSDGSIYFTDPTFRMPFSEREVESNGVYRVTPDGAITLVAEAELPNGLAFSPDERTLYVANTRATQYILAFDIGADGGAIRRRIFADMSSTEQGGAPDGMKVDVAGNVYCTGAGGTWVFSPGGELLGIIRLPEIAANLAFGGSDLQTLLFTARTSVYSIRVKVPGQPHPWYRLAAAA